jgi:hypothetical protein
MRRNVAGAVALLALLPSARVLDEPRPTGAPAEQSKALVAEYDRSVKDFIKALGAAKDNTERQKVFDEKNPRILFAPRFLELAEKYPRDAAAVDALVWVFSNSSADPALGGLRRRALGLVKREYLPSDKIGPLCEALAPGLDSRSRDVLQTVLEKSPHADVKAAACLALATNYQHRARMARQFKERPGLAKACEDEMGKEGVEEVEKKGEEGLNKEALQYLERVVKEFPDARDEKGRSLARDAKARIDGILHPLAVGTVAPEVEGEDTDGKAFKLSDYRGKVVLLDFWGHW